MAAKYLCWGDFTLTDPWRLLRACWPLNKQELYQCRQPQKQREWCWSEQGTSLCWFYTHAHATTDQSAEIAPDTWHAANKADKHRGMRGSARRKRPESGCWSSVNDKLMGRGGCNGVWSGRPRETARETICLSAQHWLSPLTPPFYRLSQSVIQTHRHSYKHTRERERDK